MIVDCHSHLIPQSMLDDLARRRRVFPSINPLASDGRIRLEFSGRAPTRPVMPRLRETEERFAWMEQQGIAHQICGGWLDAFGYELPADEGRDWARFTNEHLLRAVEHEPRLSALATVPLQDGRVAAKILEEAMEAGFAGAMLGTQPRGHGTALDDPALTPFWETASALGAILFVHPVFDVSDPRVLDYDMVNAVARLNDTTTAIARLLFSGHLIRYEGVHVVVATGGAAIPFCLGRLVRNTEIHPGQYADPREGFRRLWFDTVVFEPEALEYLVARVGVERVMLGSDWPFPIGDTEPRRVVETSRLEPEAREAILGNNARRLFSLPST